MYIYKQHHYYVYILTSPQRTVLYTGVTNNLSQRIIEHWSDRGNPKHLPVSIIVTTWSIMNISPTSSMQLREKKRSKDGADKRRSILLKR
jgi:putative endonuclease